MVYESVFLEDTIHIREIVTVHYFEYQRDFSFSGEIHDFWEFLCVDKGEVNISTDTRNLSLQRGDIIFHKPNEFHSLSANHRIAPNLVVISFICTSPAMDFFRDKVLTIDSCERNLLAQIITAAKETFAGRLDNPYQTKMNLNTKIPIGSAQLISLHLELFLLHLMRRYLASELPQQKNDAILRKRHGEIYHRVIDYLSEHINEHLTIEQICRDTLTSRSQLQVLIREKHNCGIIELFTQMKITEAKQLIRDNHFNFTEISVQLGYNSVHYFSRQFKQITGMTPSEYSSSIKGLSEYPES